MLNDTEWTMPYAQLVRKVLLNEENLGDIEIPDIVVPDTNSTDRGTPGLVAMYNESSGLRLDDSKRICIAPATESDIEAGVSHNKPIVPAFFRYALSFFLDGMFKRVVVPKGGTFELIPGMFAIIFPWDKAWFYDPSGNSIFKNDITGEAIGGGTSFVFATGPMTGSVSDPKGSNYDVAVLSIDGLSSKSSHNTYSTTSGYCYFKNTHSSTTGTGNAYVYYLG